MSTDNPWTYHANELADAHSRWLKGNPPQKDRGKVNKRLADLLTNPMRLGNPDRPDDPDPAQQFRRRVPDTDVVISYVLNMDERLIHVAEIEYAANPQLF